MVMRKIPLALLLLPGFAWATPSVGGSVQSTTSIINRIVNSTPGINTITTTGTGVTVRGAAGTAVNVGRGVTVAVPTTAEAAITAGRIAGVAARAIKWGSWIGVASVVIPWMAEQSGIKVCPAPDFFCKPGAPVPVDPVGKTGYWGNTPYNSSLPSFYAGTAQGVCDKIDTTMPSADRNVHGSLVFKAGASSPFVGSCTGSKDNAFINLVGYSSPTCPDGTPPKPDAYGRMSCSKDGPDVPATEADIGNSVEGAITGKPDRIGSLYQAEVGGGLAVMSPGDPVTVTAAPVSTPTVVSTSTVPNADGTTSTVKVETKTEVKPAPTGSTLGDTTINYPATTTTTTTTTNNNTNVSTVTTNITNNYGTESATQPNAPPQTKPPVTPDAGPAVPGSPGNPNSDIKIPTDYNREVTQGKILAQLDGSLVTAATPADQEARTQTEVSKTDQSLDAKFKALPGEIAGDKANWFSWVWTPPVGQCSASMFTGEVHGYQVNWDICSWVDRIRDVLGWLFALFGAINIYSNLFRKGND